MAGPYYVDIGTIGAWNSRDGLSSGACWYGLSGLQNAFDRVLAGEICYVKGTGDINYLYTVPYDANSGDLTDGEAVTWHDGAGVVHFLGAMATPVQIELSSGNPPDDGDVVTGTTSGNTITAHTTIARSTINVDTNSGAISVGGFIKFIGVNGSWTRDGTRAIITGVNTAGVHIFTLNGTADMVWWENIEAKSSGGSAKDGWTSVTAGSTAHVFVNCCANNNSGNGFNTYLIGASFFYRCVSYSNTLDGWHENNLGSNLFMFCASHHNTQMGWDGPYNHDVLIGCISHGNSYGINVINIGTVFNCVLDGNTNDGIYVGSITGANGVVRFIASRFTNNGGDGSDFQSRAIVVGHLYAEDNAANNFANTELQAILTNADGSTTIEEDQADTDEGYTDRAGHDFSTRYVDADDPTLRRTAVTVPWS